MKLKTIPFVVGLGMFSSVAFAQSSVVLYGLEDLGIEYKNNVPTANGGVGNQVQMQSGNLQGSRFGLEGTEDLGDGLQAIFKLEAGFALNTGVSGQGGRLFGRKAYVGLQGNWGTLTVGRQFNLLYDQMYVYDALQFALYSAYSQDSQLASSADDSVKYVVNLNGWQVSAFYSSGYNSLIANSAQVPGDTKIGREMSVSLLYQRPGPFSAGVAYDQLQGTTTATQDATQQRIVAGASYAFGPASVYAGYRWLNNQNQLPSLSSNLFWTGVRYKVSTPLSISVGAYKTQYRQLHNGPTSAVILADYLLSKSTDLYAQASCAWNTKNSDMGIDGAGFNTIDGATQTGAMIGIRHTF